MKITIRTNDAKKIKEILDMLDSIELLDSATINEDAGKNIEYVPYPVYPFYDWYRDGYTQYPIITGDSKTYWTYMPITTTTTLL